MYKILSQLNNSLPSLEVLEQELCYHLTVYFPVLLMSLLQIFFVVNILPKISIELNSLHIVYHLRIGLKNP